MIGAWIYLQLAIHRPAEAVLGQHPLHGALDDELRLALEQGAEALLAKTARIVAVPEVALLAQLIARDADLGGVQDHHVVPGVEMGRVDRLVLALEQGGDPRRQPAECLVGGIDHPPAAVDLARLDGVGLHVSCSPVMPWRAPAWTHRSWFVVWLSIWLMDR